MGLCAARQATSNLQMGTTSTLTGGQVGRQTVSGPPWCPPRLAQRCQWVPAACPNHIYRLVVRSFRPWITSSPYATCQDPHLIRPNLSYSAGVPLFDFVLPLLLLLSTPVCNTTCYSFTFLIFFSILRAICVVSSCNRSSSPSSVPLDAPLHYIATSAYPSRTPARFLVNRRGGPLATPSLVFSLTAASSHLFRPNTPSLKEKNKTNNGQSEANSA